MNSKILCTMSVGVASATKQEFETKSSLLRWPYFLSTLGTNAFCSGNLHLYAWDLVLPLHFIV